MNAKHLIWNLTAASLLASSSVGVAGTEQGDHERHGVVGGPLPRAVREATARFRDINIAIAEGYIENGGCVSGQERGAMGVHYVKPALFDDEIDVESPEVLVYEPRNGRLQLVAAEYVTPKPAWDASHAPGVQPQLMGHLYHFVAGPNRYGPDSFYELHVWAWKANPSGAFSDWNPTVSCTAWPNTP
jgi:hypothetical protein